MCLAGAFSTSLPSFGIRIYKGFVKMCGLSRRHPVPFRPYQLLSEGILCLDWQNRTTGGELPKRLMRPSPTVIQNYCCVYCDEWELSQ